jgi:hypothetical protein
MANEALIRCSARSGPGVSKSTHSRTQRRADSTLPQRRELIGRRDPRDMAASPSKLHLGSADQADTHRLKPGGPAA